MKPSAFARISLCIAGLALAGSLACDKSNDAEKPKTADANAEAGAPSEDLAEPKRPTKASKNPHAGMAMGGNPLAGGPMVKQVKRGPPRDVTPSGELVTALVEDVQFQIPKEWESQEVASPMRKAQYMLPGPGGDAELVVYRFPGGGGSFDKNLDRWLAQVEQPDGTVTKDSATIEDKTVGVFTIKQVDVTGKFKAPNMPGAPAGEDIEQARVWAVMVEGKGDPLYLKVVGPAQTVDIWADAWTAVLDSVSEKTG